MIERMKSALLCAIAFAMGWPVGAWIMRSHDGDANNASRAKPNVTANANASLRPTVEVPDLLALAEDEWTAVLNSLDGPALRRAIRSLVAAP